MEDICVYVSALIKTNIMPKIEVQYLISGFWTRAGYRRRNPLVVYTNRSKSFRYNVFILGFWKATIFSRNSLWLDVDIFLISGCHNFWFMLSQQTTKMKIQRMNLFIQIVESMIAWKERSTRKKKDALHGCTCRLCLFPHSYKKSHTGIIDWRVPSMRKEKSRLVEKDIERRCWHWPHKSWATHTY